RVRGGGCGLGRGLHAAGAASPPARANRANRDAAFPQPRRLGAWVHVRLPRLDVRAEPLSGPCAPRAWTRRRAGPGRPLLGLGGRSSLPFPPAARPTVERRTAADRTRLRVRVSGDGAAVRAHLALPGGYGVESCRRAHGRAAVR